MKNTGIRCASLECGGRLKTGERVRVVPVFSAHDPANFGPTPRANPIREDHYHPACADRAGLCHDPDGGIVYLRT